MDSTSRETAPVVIDLGKQKRSRVKNLRSGGGPLLNDARVAIQELRQAGTIHAEATPVILVVEKKAKPRGIFQR